MKKLGNNAKNCSATLAAAFVLGLLVNCGPGGDEASTEAREETTEALQAAKDHLAEERDRIRGQVSAEVAALEERSAKLRRQAKDAGGSAEAALNRKVEAVETKTKELRHELEETSDKSESAWDDFSARSAQALDEIRKGLDEAAAELK